MQFIRQKSGKKYTYLGLGGAKCGQTWFPPLRPNSKRYIVFYYIKYVSWFFFPTQKLRHYPNRLTFTKCNFVMLMVQSLFSVFCPSSSNQLGYQLGLKGVHTSSTLIPSRSWPVTQVPAKHSSWSISRCFR